MSKVKVTETNEQPKTVSPVKTKDELENEAIAACSLANKENCLMCSG